MNTGLTAGDTIALITLLLAVQGSVFYVVQRLAESGDRRAEFAGVVRAMPVVVVEERLEASGALVGVGVGVANCTE